MSDDTGECDPAKSPDLSGQIRAIMAERGIIPDWLALIADVPAAVVMRWHRGEDAIYLEDFVKLVAAIGYRL